MTGMSFLEHLEELRRRIVHSVLYILGGFGICWWFHERIFAHHAEADYDGPGQPSSRYQSSST